MGSKLCSSGNVLRDLGLAEADAGNLRIDAIVSLLARAGLRVTGKAQARTI